MSPAFRSATQTGRNKGVNKMAKINTPGGDVNIPDGCLVVIIGIIVVLFLILK